MLKMYAKSRLICLKHVSLVNLKTHASLKQIVILLTKLHFKIAGNFVWSQKSLVLSLSLKTETISKLNDSKLFDLENSPKKIDALIC